MAACLARMPVSSMELMHERDDAEAQLMDKMAQWEELAAQIE